MKISALMTSDPVTCLPVSAAGTLLLTEVTMTEVPDPKPDTAALDAA